MTQYHIKKDDSQDPDKGEDFNYTWLIVTQRRKRTMSQNQLNSANHVVSVFAVNLKYEFSVVAYNEILFYISYKVCSAFPLCSSMIVFYNSLEVIKLAFLENKSDMFVVCLLTLYSHLKQNFNQWSDVYFTDPINSFLFLVFLLSS